MISLLLQQHGLDGTAVPFGLVVPNLIFPHEVSNFFHQPFGQSVAYICNLTHNGGTYVSITPHSSTIAHVLLITSHNLVAIQAITMTHTCPHMHPLPSCESPIHKTSHIFCSSLFSTAASPLPVSRQSVLLTHPHSSFLSSLHVWA